MLRFFQNSARQAAVGTGSVLAATVVANVTYRLGLFAYDTIKNKPIFSGNPPPPPTSAGTTDRLHNNSHDDSHDKVASGRSELGL